MDVWSLSDVSGPYHHERSRCYNLSECVLGGRALNISGKRPVPSVYQLRRCLEMNLPVFLKWPVFFGMLLVIESDSFKIT